MDGADTINLSWLGYLALKCPMDLWVYQELLVQERPDFVVETGTNRGGSALFLASVMDLIDHGRVISIDIEPDEGRPKHSRITYVHGSSVDPAVLERVRDVVEARSAMVILDSDHRKEHVLAEMFAYAPLVSVGNHLVVEDTNINGHPTRPSFGPGPMEAVESFLASTDEFEVDRRCERFLMTLNPNGYLRRVQPGKASPTTFRAPRTLDADTVRRGWMRPVTTDRLESLRSESPADGRLVRMPDGRVYLCEGEWRRHVTSTLVVDALSHNLGEPADVDPSEAAAVETLSAGSPLSVLQTSSGASFVIAGGRLIRVPGVPRVTHLLGEIPPGAIGG